MAGEFAWHSIQNIWELLVANRCPKNVPDLIYWLKVSWCRDITPKCCVKLAKSYKSCHCLCQILTLISTNTHCFGRFNLYRNIVHNTFIIYNINLLLKTTASLNFWPRLCTMPPETQKLLTHHPDEHWMLLLVLYQSTRIHEADVSLDTSIETFDADADGADGESHDEITSVGSLARSALTPDTDVLWAGSTEAGEGGGGVSADGLTVSAESQRGRLHSTSSSLSLSDSSMTSDSLGCDEHSGRLAAWLTRDRGLSSCALMALWVSLANCSISENDFWYAMNARHSCVVATLRFLATTSGMFECRRSFFSALSNMLIDCIIASSFSSTGPTLYSLSDNGWVVEMPVTSGCNFGCWTGWEHVCCWVETRTSSDELLLTTTAIHTDHTQLTINASSTAYQSSRSTHYRSFWRRS